MPQFKNHHVFRAVGRRKNLHLSEQNGKAVPGNNEIPQPIRRTNTSFKITNVLNSPMVDESGDDDDDEDNSWKHNFETSTPKKRLKFKSQSQDLLQTNRETRGASGSFRFKVVQIKASLHVIRGRWKCVDYHDKAAEKNRPKLQNRVGNAAMQKTRQSKSLHHPLTGNANQQESFSTPQVEMRNQSSISFPNKLDQAYDSSRFQANPPNKLSFCEVSTDQTANNLQNFTQNRSSSIITPVYSQIQQSSSVSSQCNSPLSYGHAQFQFGFAPPVSIPPEHSNYSMASTSPNQITHQNQPQMQVFNFLESVSSPVATIKKYVQGTSFPFHSTEVQQCKSFHVGQSQGLANFGPCISRFPVNFNMRQALNRSFFSLPLSEAYSSSNNRKSLWTPVPGLPSSQHSLISNDCSTGSNCTPSPRLESQPLQFPFTSGILQDNTTDGELDVFKPTESANSGYAVLNNRIEQAMDLVKSHVIDAVTSEVEELTTKIWRLEEIVAQLKLENDFFRIHAGEELINRCKEQTVSKSQVCGVSQVQNELRENGTLFANQNSLEQNGPDLKNGSEDEEDKSSDSEIGKNDKCISNCTNEFLLLGDSDTGEFKTDPLHSESYDEEISEEKT